MAYSLSPWLKPRFFITGTNRPLAGGLMYTYKAGTTTPATTYSNDSGTANTNPIVLDSDGQCDLFLDDSISYRIILKNAAGVTQFDKDNITSLGTKQVQSFNTIAALRLKSGTTLSNSAKTLGYYSVGDGGANSFYWDSSSSATDNNGIVIKPTAVSGAGRWLAADPKTASIFQFGAVSGSSSDIGAIITAMNTAGVRKIIINDGDFRLTTSALITNKCEIVGMTNCKIILDWTSLGAAGKGFYVTADNTYIHDVYFDVLATPTARNNDGSAAAIVVNADGCTVERCRGVTQPTLVYSYKTNCSIYVRDNEASGMFDGLSSSSNDNHGVRIADGEKCFVTGNKFTGFPQAILADLSTNNSHFTGNTAILCGNHCVYVSSGEHNLIDNNIAIGQFTDIKARGDFNAITNNKVYGGIIEMTNRIADGTTSPLGDTSGFHAGVIANNTVMCERIGAYGIALDNRTGFTCIMRNATITGNSVFGKDGTNAQFYGILASGLGLENITINSNTVNGSLDDGIIVTTLPFVAANAKLISLSGNAVSNSKGSGIQVSGNQCVVSNNAVFNADATGTSDGLIFGIMTNSIITNNTLNDSGGGTGSAIREGTGSDNNYISGNKYQNATGGIVTVGTGTIVENVIIGSTTYNPPSIAAGATTSTTVTVTGASLGDFVEMVSFSLDTQLITFSAYVSSANTVTVVLTNTTAGAIDLGSGTLRVRVNKR